MRPQHSIPGVFRMLCYGEVLHDSFQRVSLAQVRGVWSLPGGQKRCVSGEHKSLTVPVGEPLFPLGWLADYPGLYTTQET
jgi:hypothetical protein